MKTRIINSGIGEISKAIYISANSDSVVYYNAGRGGIDYRFLEYGASYFTTDPSDFNILDHLSGNQFSRLYGEEEEILLDYDELENLYKTSVPHNINTDEQNPEFRNYFGSFVASQRTIYVFIAPAGVETIRLYGSIDASANINLPAEEDADLLVTFETDREIRESKVVYIAISQEGNKITGEIQVSLTSWMQLINPIRKKPDTLLSVPRSRARVPRMEKRGDVWYDATSGTILGNKKVQSPILDRKIALVGKPKYSPWRVYGPGDKAIYPKTKKYDYTLSDFDEILTLPAGKICIYGNCNIKNITVTPPNSYPTSIWWGMPNVIDEVRGKQVFRYITSMETSLVSRAFSRNVDDEEVPDQQEFRPIKLRRADKEYGRIEFTLDAASNVKITCVSGYGLSKEGVCMIVEYPHSWTSIRDENIGNPPSEISPYWSSDEDLTNYYTKVTEIVCHQGKVLPSGLINITSDTDRIGAKLVLRPGWDVKKELLPTDNPRTTQIQPEGVQITQRIDLNEDIYYYVQVSRGSGWKRKYIINTVPATPEIYFKFPIFTSNSIENIGYSGVVNISDFYRESGNLDAGITINLKSIIMAYSNYYPTNQVPLSEFLDTLQFNISPDFPDMVINDTTGIATVESVGVHNGIYTFVPSNKRLAILVANSYDFSISNPYDYVEYGGIVDGISFKSETGAIPGWIWIDKILDNEEKTPVKCSLAGLNETGRVIIDGSGYNFSQMIVTRDGDEYHIKIVDVKNTIKIDIIEA